VNNYCRLSDLKADVAGVSGTTYDATYLRAMEVASREIDRYCNRRFYAEVGTVYLDGNGKAELPLAPVPGECDLLSVSSLTVDDDDDGAYETTLVEGTDFRLWPVNVSPAWRLDMLTRGSQLSRWPRGQATVKVVGTWGYSEDLDATGLTGTVADATTTTITASASAASLVYPGDTIKIGSEQLYVTAVVTTSLTVTRGVNGTTAAAHSGEAISVRRYPPEIEEAVRVRVVSARWDNNQGVPLGDIGGNEDVRRWARLIGPYRLRAV